MAHEIGHPIGDPRTYVPVEEPSIASEAGVILERWIQVRGR